MKQMLNGPWQGKCLGEDGFSFSATVPGCVHSDLAGKRLPADLQVGKNADAGVWIEDRDWEYEKVFTVTQIPENISLVFEGLDTYADIWLNGTHLGSTDNMFIPHRFGVEKQLRLGENTLTVRFRSPVRQVADREPRKAAFGDYGRLYTRRIQCTYGWDWVARFVTCGIWRDVYLEAQSGLRVKDAYVYTEAVYEGGAQIVVEARLEDYSQGGYLDMQILDPDGKQVYSHRWYRKEDFLKEHIDLPDARLWYPAGYGQQPLYTLLVGQKRISFGIRSLQILQLPDAPGSPWHDLCLALKQTPGGLKYDQNQQFSGFVPVVNGQKVLCKGANWVPSEPLPSQETPQKITALLELAREAGVNMQRVWGGGIFEQDHFYSECDRLGILVTQDFLMACGHYPEEDRAFLAQLRREAEFAALTLRNHPCLAWWSGDNENAVLGDDEAQWYKGRAAIHEAIYPVLMALDPRRRFMLSSPCGGKTYASKTVGTTHNTQYLGQECFPFVRNTDLTDYKDHFGHYLARFIAEEPTTGAISLPSLRRFMTDREIFETEELWQYHTKSNPALSFTLFDFLQDMAKKLLGNFRDGRDRLFKLQYTQYEWVRVTMENICRNRGFVNGLIYWMWNDCWAAASGWSFVDYYCLPKLSYYAFKRCAGQLVASIEKKQGFQIFLCNDSPEGKTVSLKLYTLTGGSQTLFREETVSVAARSAGRVLTLPEEILPRGGMLLCEAVSGELCDRTFYREGTLPMVPCAAEMQRNGDRVTVRAKGYVHAVNLEGEYLFSDNGFCLYPGESRTVTLRKAPNAQTDDLTLTAYTVET